MYEKFKTNQLKREKRQTQNIIVSYHIDSNTTIEHCPTSSLYHWELINIHSVDENGTANYLDFKCYEYYRASQFRMLEIAYSNK